MVSFLGVDPATGRYLVADKDGKPTADPDYNTDRTVFINTLPKFYGGLQNTLHYKGFDIDVLFRFTRQIARPFNSYYSFNLGQFSHYVSSGNQPVNVLDRWRKPGDVASFQKFTANFYSQTASYLKGGSDADFLDGSFARLQNISLSWQLPDIWRQKMHLQKCRIYVQAQNLLTICNYEGFDPDIQSAGTMPPLRGFTIGLQAIL